MYMSDASAVTKLEPLPNISAVGNERPWEGTALPLPTGRGGRVRGEQVQCLALCIISAGLHTLFPVVG